VDTCFMNARLFRRGTPSAFALSPIGTSAPAFGRDGADGAGGMPRERAGARQRALVLRAEANWQRAGHRLWFLAIHTGAALNLQAQLELRATGRGGDVTGAAQAPKRPRRARLKGGRKPSFFLVHGGDL
jgi:hypothetical protein